nr:hypothetical protein [uncultured Chryseobacterium sp.]
MTEKPLSQQSIDELYQNEDKAKKSFMYNSVILLCIIGISIFMTSENGFGFYTFFPVFFSYTIFSSYSRLKNIREEIESRILHLKN